MGLVLDTDGLSKERVRRAVNRTVTCGLLIALSLPIGACTFHSRSPDPKVLTAFSDFVFVGSGRHQPASGLAPSAEEFVVPHGDQEQSRPQSLERGVQYVFHDRHHIDDERFALEVLPKKLNAASLRIVKAPQSSKELMHLFIGGPLFVVRFEDHGLTGYIYNKLESGVTKESAERTGIPEDHILFYP